ncbi:VWA domain-containing protein [Paenibacillus sp. TRM 82003]|nr:VWA domain-containing protein [Paenibacillus sp. TRM 82003]
MNEGAATGKMEATFKQTWERRFAPANGSERLFVLLEACGRGGAARSERPPMNVSLVLDRSGSMAGAPLAYSKQACRYAADRIGPADTLSLVAFDDTVQTVVAPAEGTDRTLVRRRIEAIEPGGCTNLSGGFIEGASHARDLARPGATSRVILLSDGHANQGVTDRGRLAAMAREFLHAGVAVTTMGVGDGFDEELMEAMAEHGGGNFYYIRTPEQIPSIFERELNGLLGVVAQNAKLTLRPAAGVRVSRVYGFSSSHAADGATLVHVGDLADGETKSILVELAIDSQPPGRRLALTLDWEYVDVTEGAARCASSRELFAEYTNDRELLGLPADDEVARQVELTRAGLAIESAMAAMDEGRLEDGRQLLEEQAEHLLLMSERLEAPTLAAESEAIREQLRDFAYSSRTRKELHAQKYRQLRRK